MMKFSDKALQLIGRKLLSSMEASPPQESSTLARNSPPPDGALAIRERANSLLLRQPDSVREKARVLPFRNGDKDDP